MPESITEQIHSLFENELRIEVPSHDTDLIDEGLLDSLVFVDLIVGLETMFEVDIPVAEIDLDMFRSVIQIGSYIESLKTGSRSPSETAA